MSEPQRNLTVDALEVVDGRDHEKMEGWIPELATEAELRDALEKAFDYRGDVTITRKDGSRVEGYVFDRRNGPTLDASMVRLIPQNSSPQNPSQKISIAYSAGNPGRSQFRRDARRPEGAIARPARRLFGRTDDGDGLCRTARSRRARRPHCAPTFARRAGF